MMKNKYMLSASGMYINYFLLGMVNIMLASNMSFLTKQLNTDGAGISYIISAIGIGNCFRILYQASCLINSDESL